MTKSNFKPSLQSIKVTRELTKILTENNLSEIQIEEGDIKIKLSRRNHAITDIYQETKDEVNAREVTLNTKNNKLTTESNSDHTSHINAIKSPMVGTVYTRPSPDADPFVKVNDKVKEGDTIVLIEAMKTFNSITATKSGTITKILIENAQPVEFGDPLFTIE